MIQDEDEIFNRIIARSEDLEYKVDIHNPSAHIFPEGNDLWNIMEEEFNLREPRGKKRSYKDVYLIIPIIERIIVSKLPKTTRALYSSRGVNLALVSLKDNVPDGAKNRISEKLEVILRVGMSLYQELDAYGYVVMTYQFLSNVSGTLKDGNELGRMQDFEESIERMYNYLHPLIRDEWYYERMKFVIRSAMLKKSEKYLDKIKKKMDRKVLELDNDVSNNIKEKKIMYKVIKEHVESAKLQIEERWSEVKQIEDAIKIKIKGPATRGWRAKIKSK